jgi:GTP cyclohydrolase I
MIMADEVQQACAGKPAGRPARAGDGTCPVPAASPHPNGTPARTGPALRVIGEPGNIGEPGSGIDLSAAEHAAAEFLQALGIELDSESLRGTPGRMARAYAELFTPRPFGLTTFPNDEGYDELVLARAIPVRSVCEHHLLPFTGVAHVGYLPGQRILGLSKLARIVEHFARRPQVQERMTKQIADWLYAHLHPQGAGVVIEAEHTCMTLRGIQAAGSRTVTSTLLGTLREDPRSRQEFFSLTGVSA